MQRSAFALGIAAALVFSGFTRAGFALADEVRKIEVAYPDLDLSQPAAASTLFSRIQRAAYSVCEVNTVPNPQALILQHRCMAKAVDEAVHRVDNPNLTAVYLAKAGKRAMVASNR